MMTNSRVSMVINQNDEFHHRSQSYSHSDWYYQHLSYWPTTFFRKTLVPRVHTTWSCQTSYYVSNLRGRRRRFLGHLHNRYHHRRRSRHRQLFRCFRRQSCLSRQDILRSLPWPCRDSGFSVSRLQVPHDPIRFKSQVTALTVKLLEFQDNLFEKSSGINFF